MGGLRKIAKALGGMSVNGVRWAWDYAADIPVLESEMMAGSERWLASERAKWAKIAAISPTQRRN